MNNQELNAPKKRKKETPNIKSFSFLCYCLPCKYAIDLN